MRPFFLQSLFFAILLIVSGCQSESTKSLIGWDYFPLAVGNYWIYEIAETGQVFEMRVQALRQIEKQVYFEVTNLPEFGQYTQETPARRWVRYDALAHQFLEYVDGRDRILMDLGTVLQTKFPLSPKDYALRNQVIPYGSFDDRSEQGNCAYEPNCSLGRTLFVQGIGIVAHARFPNRPRHLAEYTYYLKEALTDNVRHVPYFTEPISLTWDEEPASRYRTCSPAFRFERLDRRMWRYTFSDSLTQKSELGIMSVINAKYRFGPLPAPGTQSVQLGKLDFDLNYDQMRLAWQLVIKLSSRRAVESTLGSYVIMVGATHGEGHQTYLCYLFLEL
jgi:hypothetical protein